MSRYTKKDITFHQDGYGSTPHAAIEVKVQQWLRPLERDAIQDNHEWDDGEMTAAAHQVWEWLHYEFWSVELPRLAKEHNVEHLVIQAAGRSDGWVEAQRADEETVASWNAIDVARWGRFERAVKQIVQQMSSVERARTEFKEYAAYQDS